MSYDPLVLLCKAHGLPEPETDVLFLPDRKFRADYLWRAAMLIVEQEGGLFSKGRAGRAHAMPFAILRDMEKANLAQLAGFVYLRYTPQQIQSGAILETLKRALQ